MMLRSSPDLQTSRNTGTRRDGMPIQQATLMI
jgi:hypothetical protein